MISNNSLSKSMCVSYLQSSNMSHDGRLTVVRLSFDCRSKLLKLVTVLALLLTVGVGQMWGTDEVYKTLTFPDDNSSSNGLTSNQYTSTWTATIDDDSWSISNFNNNNWNNSWAYIKAGPKNTTSTGTIATSAAYSSAVTKVVIDGSFNAASSSEITSTKLIIASNSVFTADKVEVTGPTTFTDGEMTFNVASPAANRYYKLEVTVNNKTPSGSKGKNGLFQVNSVTYYVAGCTSLASINGSIFLTNAKSLVRTFI